MGSGIHRRLRDTFTYWQATGYGAHGERIFASPVTYTPPYSGAHWEDLPDVRVDLMPGDIQRPRAHVYTQQQVFAEGYMYKGVSVVVDPTGLVATLSGAGATKIRRVDATPSTNSSIILYRAVCD